MLTLYRIFTFLIYYIAWPFLFAAGMAGSIKWKNRLGYLQVPDKTGEEKTIWLHASSIGEVKVLAILKDHLEKADSDISVFITVMTEAGYQSAGRLVINRNRVAYLPLDYRSAINRFISSIRPRAAVFIETEIWPNIIDNLGKKNIPIFLANGRLSEKSCNNYVRFRKTLGRLFENYRRLMVQSETDKKRYIKIGAPEERIEVIGNLKFDAAAETVSADEKEQLKKGLPFEKEARLFIAGSTRREENEIILRTYKKLTKKYPGLNLILVPRHLEKISEIERLAGKYGISYCLYSECGLSTQEVSAVVVDKIGLLNRLYSISDIAFVGGTLADIGGQNILEPVWAGIPVLYGPSIFNVRDSSQYILENRLGAMVKDENELYDKLHLFFSNELVFKRKDETSTDKSRAGKTAQTIFENI
ncbi:MAG: hypothetical protein DRP51_06150 [Candidatus Zixiibacteriota bacterium]|nr:MAG: hypothetical protein DRP51_06150 [candidate division Zixibacteria bacterium]